VISGIALAGGGPLKEWVCEGPHDTSRLVQGAGDGEERTRPNRDAAADAARLAELAPVRSMIFTMDDVPPREA
jgi:hypothetical protein